MEKQGFLEKMKERWSLKSLTQVVLVLIIFSLTGMSVVLVKPFLFKFFKMSNLHLIEQILLYIILIFPLYQILFLVYGTLLGQFWFCWNWEKKTIKAIGRVFTKKKNDS